jgi:ABC-type multidrug transport system ATPase subunit
VTGLSKRYGDVISVDDISFDVGRGELFSLYDIRRKWIL